VNAISKNRNIYNEVKMNKNLIIPNGMLMPEINIEVLNSFKVFIKIVSGYFYENGLSAIAHISPIFIDDISKIEYLKINEIMWKIEEKSPKDSSSPNLPRCFYEFTLVKCSD